MGADERAGFLHGTRTWLAGDADQPTCEVCGHDWSMAPDEALDVLARSPARYAALLLGRDGMVPAADGGWNATSYVWHLADLARGWAERWVVVADAPGTLLAGWDPDELADARNYRNMPTVSALWSLTTGVELLIERSRVLAADTPFEHGDWGTGTVGEALVWLAHEFTHHEHDVDERAAPA